MIEAIKTFFILLTMSIGAMYYLSWRTGDKAIIPGDIYIKKAGREYYFPLGSSLLLTIVLYLILGRVAEWLGL